METKFKGILEKFMESTHSMEEVYTELTYLTSNYDKEIEKIHKELEEERARANNEEYMRKETEANLQDLKALQQINFSTIINDLIEKPKDEFTKSIKAGITKFIFAAIIIALVSSVLSVAATYFYILNINPINQSSTKHTDHKKDFQNIISQIKKENTELKNFIKNNIDKHALKMQVVEPKKEEMKEEKKEQLPKETAKEVKNEQKPELTVENKEQFLEKVLTTLENYDKRFKLNSKNDTRLLYKMFMLDLAPFKHDIFLQELNLFAKANTYIPTENEIKIWDKQMLYIYTNMLEKFKATPNNKRTDQMRLFYNYKKDDATQYQGWEYVGQEGLSVEESLEKEIEKLNAQIVLNSN